MFSIFKTYFIDPVLPPRCPVSGDIVQENAFISPESWARLRFITYPFCESCGIPFGHTAEPSAPNCAGLLCLTCLSYPPQFDTARAPLVYNDDSRKIVLAFKYGDQQQCALTMTRFMARCVSDPARYDAVIPVPLHRGRLIRRRFNQSAVLARHIGRMLHIPYRPDYLVRTRATPQQKQKNYKQRRKNVRSAFAVPDLRSTEIKNAQLLLIDDVFSTGATVNECSKTLKKEGAERIDVLTFAQTVKD